MSEWKHTPGPWRASNGPYVAILADGDTGHDDPDSVAAYGGHLVCESVAERNRLIILGAPELLDKLKALVALAERTGIADSDPPEYLAAVAAIAILCGTAS